jgi:hypothetical protein
MLHNIELKLKGIVARDLMRVKRPADGVENKSYKYNRIRFICNINAVSTLDCLNLYAQPASHVGAYASGFRIRPAEQSALAGHRELQELLICKYR